MRVIPLVATVVWAGCGPAREAKDAVGADSAATSKTPSAAIQLTDDGGHVVRLQAPARRIISLIPSATETVIALGIADRIVGRTRYDVDPQVISAPLVGGGIDPSIETIVGLRPDLVLAWSNDKRQEAPKKLMALGIPVFTVRTEDTSDVFRTLDNIGRLTGRDSAAQALATSLRSQLDDVRRSVSGKPARKVLYVVYNDPPMTAGSKTFIGQLLSLAGGKSIFAENPELWPNVSMEEIVRRQPDLIVVPVGEFRNNSIARFRGVTGWRDLRAVREGHVVEVPADLLSRPGPHMGEAARTLRNAMFPDLATSTGLPR